MIVILSSLTIAAALSTTPRAGPGFDRRKRCLSRATCQRDFRNASGNKLAADPRHAASFGVFLDEPHHPWCDIETLTGISTTVGTVRRAQRYRLLEMPDQLQR